MHSKNVKLLKILILNISSPSNVIQDPATASPIRLDYLRKVEPCVTTYLDIQMRIYARLSRRRFECMNDSSRKI
jgi:hypothetical protein